jgi:Domain of unknown function (DUF3854)
MSTTTEWENVTAEKPCACCDRGDWCSRSTDGRVEICRRQGVTGWIEKDSETGPIWVHRLDDEPSGVELDLAIPAGGSRPIANPDTLNRAYLRLLHCYNARLTDAARADLDGRGFPLSEAVRRGYASVPTFSEIGRVADGIASEFGSATFLSIPGFYANSKGRPWIQSGPGLLIPVRDCAGRIIAVLVRLNEIRDPKDSRYVWLSSKGKKKRFGPSPGTPAHVPLGIERPAPRVRLTEGALKADLAQIHSGLPTIGAAGVGCWRRAVPILKDLQTRVVVLAFDDDWKDKGEVAINLELCAAGLTQAGFELEVETWDRSAGKGIDEVLAAGARPQPLVGDDVVVFLKTVGERAKAHRDSHGNGNGNGHCVTTGVIPPSGKPQIILTTDVKTVTDEAVAAISDDDRVYQRNNTLVRVLSNNSLPPKKKDVRRPLGTPRIVPIPMPIVRELVSANADVVHYKKVDGEYKLVSAIPPEWLITGVSARGEWSSVRHLEGIVEAPTMRPDGTILDVPGWDEATGLLYVPNADFPPVPEMPSFDDAERAAAMILDVVSDFPFASDTDKSEANKLAWLAGFLTPIVRYAIDGACPLFLLDANTSGAGKGKLLDIIAIAATGREMPCAGYPDDEAEMAKQILAIALAGDLMVCFDNVSTGWAIGGASLDRAITARTVKGRILGRSEMTADIPMNTIFYADGNNIGIKGDALRRIVPSRLESPEVHPEERKDFKIQGDILAYVREHRGELVVAALTILRAFVVAGRPPQNLTPMDFPAWCGLIREAIHWAWGADPCESRLQLMKDDEDTIELEALVEGWGQLCKDMDATSLTAKQALDALKENPTKHADLVQLLSSKTKKGDLPTPAALGFRFRKIRGKPTPQGSMEATPYRGINAWSVQTQPP